MSDLGRVLRLDARRTALFLAIPLLAALALLVAWRALIPGVAYWDNAVAALASSVRLLGPAAAGVAAWVAVREHRVDYLRSLTARSPATGPLLDLLLVTIVTLSAYGAAGAVIVVRTLSGDAAGSLGGLVVLASALTLVVYVAVGYLAARLVPHILMVPVVVISTLLWGLLRPDAWELLPPGIFGQVGLFAKLSPETLGYQIAWSIGLGGALVLGYVLSLTRRAWLVIPLAGAIIVACVATGKLHTGGSDAVTASPPGHTCREWPLTVCVHPALRPALPGIAAAASPLAARLEGTPGEFDRVEHRALGDRAPLPGGTVPIHVNDLSPGYERRAARQITSGLMVPHLCDDDDPGQGPAYSAMVSAWLLDQRLPHIDDPTAAGLFAGWSEQRRRTWLQEHYHGFRSCRLRTADFIEQEQARDGWIRHRW